ncbi:MAG: hypothetical protein QNJ54_05055 [Prochloraceae cyanobacterium]|nr:hypothetical protein [Prochloraceae cyanobacterium]
MRNNYLIPALVLYFLGSSIIVLFSILTLVGEDEKAGLVLLFTLPILVIDIVFWSILHYSCWQAIPEKYRATTPGKAVGFLFVPLFNLYWAFISFPSLVIGLQRAEKKRNIVNKNHNSYKLGVAYAILFVLRWLLVFLPISILDIVVDILDVVVYMLFYISINSYVKTIEKNYR